MSSPSNKSPPPHPRVKLPPGWGWESALSSKVTLPPNSLHIVETDRKKFASPLVPPPTVKSLGILEDLTGKNIALPVRKFILPIMHKIKEKISHP